MDKLLSKRVEIDIHKEVKEFLNKGYRIGSHFGRPTFFERHFERPRLTDHSLMKREREYTGVFTEIIDQPLLNVTIKKDTNSNKPISISFNVNKEIEKYLNEGYRASSAKLVLNPPVPRSYSKHSVPRSYDEHFYLKKDEKIDDKAKIEITLERLSDFGMSDFYDRSDPFNEFLESIDNDMYPKKNKYKITLLLFKN